MGLWGVLAAIATLAQLSGVHAVMLIALAARLLWIPQCKAECSRLEGCARRLHGLQDMATQHPAVAGLVAEALGEADVLLTSYRGSTLWCRVRTGGSMETQLRDMQSRLDCLCVLVLCVHANLLTAAAPDPSDATNHHVRSDPSSHGAKTSDASGSQRRDSIGQGEADDQPDKKEPGGGSESV